MATSASTTTTTITTTTTTTTSSSGAQTVIVDSSASLTTQPPEVLVQITDCLTLSEQAQLRSQVGSRHLFNFITHLLPTKRSLKLEIAYRPHKPEIKTPISINAVQRQQLNFYRAAVRRVVKQQQQPAPPKPEPSPHNFKLQKAASKQQNPKQSSSAAFTAFPLFEKVDDRFLYQIEMEEFLKFKKKMDVQKEDSLLPKGSSDEAVLSSSVAVNENKVEAKDVKFEYAESTNANMAFEMAHGYIPLAAAAFRRHVDFQPHLLSSLTNFEVNCTSHDTDCMKITAAALAALLHSPRREDEDDGKEEDGHHKRAGPIQLTSFAIYLLTFGLSIFVISFLARLYKILSSTVTPPAHNASTPTLETPYSTANSSLESLKSLTLFACRSLPNETTGFDVEGAWRRGPLYSDPIHCLPVFPAVEELVLGSICGDELTFLLGSYPLPLFPALKRLVLVLPLKKTGASAAAETTVEFVTSALQAVSAQVRQQLTALSVYSYDGLRALHKRECKREEKEAKAKMGKGNDQNEEEKEDGETEEVVNFAYGELVAYVKEHFPAVVRFNGQSI
ncbi:hypothetical protein TYRP_017524 [Tyrophagus putrescentiae]|nr:hypothetical protein TYRP_017524 [Tyrophagus putrescentiae]